VLQYVLQSVLQCVLQPWDVGIPHAQVISHMNECCSMCCRVCCSACCSHEMWVSHTHKSYHIWMSHVTHEWVISHMNESRHTWMSHITYKWVTSHMNESRHTWLLCMPALCRRNMKVPTSISQQISICTKSLWIWIADLCLEQRLRAQNEFNSVVNVSYQKNDNFGSDRYRTRSSHQHSDLSWTFPYGGVTHSDAIWLLHVWCDSFISPRN